MKNIYQLLFYWTPTNIEDAQYSTTTIWFNSYENAKKYLKKQQFNHLNQPDLIEIKEFKFNEQGEANYETTILRGLKKGLNLEFFNINKIHNK